MTPEQPKRVVTMQYNTIVDQVNQILAEYEGFPLTLRQIYYRLVANYKLPNKRQFYNGLSRILVKARELGHVNDTLIVDKQRSIEGGDSPFLEPQQYLDWKAAVFAKNDYSRAVWAEQPQHVEVWVEKYALSNVIGRAAADFNVVIAATRGYSSYTYVKRMAIDDRYVHLDKPVTILYFGDHDPSGLQMTDDLDTRMQKYGKDGSVNIVVKRIALTHDQVQHFKLDPNPVKQADSRSATYMRQFGSTCWELDALPPKELTNLVQQSLLAEIDQDTWAATRRKSEKERKQLQDKIDKWSKRVQKWVKPRKRSRPKGHAPTGTS